MPDTKPSEPNPVDFGAAANKSTDAGIADETAGYAEAAALNEEDESASKSVNQPTEGGPGEDESEGQPS